MAGRKKQPELTAEEKLQQALVPKAEQPYKVPDNWCWTRLGNYINYATDYVANGSFASLKANVNIYKEDNYALMVKTQDFANNFTKSLTYTDKQGYDFLSKSKLFGGELILSNIGSIGKVFKVPHLNKPMTLASNSIMIKCYNELDYTFLYYFFLSSIGYELLLSITTGTAVLKFNKTDLKTLPLPIPPLAEQQRIVERIETLFAKLDEAKEKLQNTLDTFETRKAAILHKAFTGELTANWRKQHGLTMDSWEEKMLEDISVIISGYAFSSKDFSQQNTIPCIKITNVGVGKYINDNYEYLPETFLNEYSKFIVDFGDILISLTRSFINEGLKVCTYTEKQRCLLNQRVAVIRNPNSKFIYYYLRTDKVLQYVKDKSKTTNQPNLSIKDLCKLNIFVPTLDEQNEIVRIIDNLLAKEQQAQQLAQNALAKIDLIKKSILARAFRGQLATNNPADEPAIELLKRML